LSTVDSVCLFVCPSVCLSVTPLQIASSFCFSVESSHFLAVISPCGTTKLFSLIFGLGPLTPKIYSPIFYGKCVMTAGAICALKDLHVGLTLVAVATKFGLGAEIQSPTGLFLQKFVFSCMFLGLCLVHGRSWEFVLEPGTPVGWEHS